MLVYVAIALMALTLLSNVILDALKGRARRWAAGVLIALRVPVAAAGLLLFVASCAMTFRRRDVLAAAVAACRADLVPRERRNTDATGEAIMKVFDGRLGPASTITGRPRTLSPRARRVLRSLFLWPAVFSAVMMAVVVSYQKLALQAFPGNQPMGQAMVMMIVLVVPWLFFGIALGMTLLTLLGEKLPAYVRTRPRSGSAVRGVVVTLRAGLAMSMLGLFFAICADFMRWDAALTSYPAFWGAWSLMLAATGFFLVDQWCLARRMWA